MTCVMNDCLKSLTLKILNPIDLVIDLMALLKGVVWLKWSLVVIEMHAKTEKLWIKSMILLKACLQTVDAHPWDANNSAGHRTITGTTPDFGYWVDDMGSNCYLNGQKYWYSWGLCKILLRSFMTIIGNYHWNPNDHLESFWHGLVTTLWIFLKGNEWNSSVLIVLIYWCGCQ